jgi:hypothetical protein
LILACSCISIADCLSKGGTVTVDQKINGFCIKCTGTIYTGTITNTDKLTSKNILLHLAHEAADAYGIKINMSTTADSIEIAILT